MDYKWIANADVRLLWREIVKLLKDHAFPYLQKELELQLLHGFVGFYIASALTVAIIAQW